MNKEEKEKNKNWFWLTVALFTISLITSFPAIFSEYLYDDYWHLSAADGRDVLELDPPFSYFSFSSGEENAVRKQKVSGWLPWWSGSELKLSFFRPFSSATIHFDYVYANGNLIWARSQSIVRFLILIAGVFSLLRMILPDRAAKFAVAAYALSTCHITVIGFIAARSTLIAVAISTWSLYCYLRWRQGGSLKWNLGAIALFALGLLSSEVSLGVPALIFAYELFGKYHSVKQRMLSMLPFVILALAFLVFYNLQGFGAFDSGLYINPFSQSTDFLNAAIPRTLSLLGELILGIPAINLLTEETRQVPVIAGVIGLTILTVGALLCWPAFDEKKRFLLKWLALGVLLSILPGIAGIIEGRAAMFSCVAVTGIAGLIIDGLLSLKGSRQRRLLHLVTALMLCCCVFISSACWRLLDGLHLNRVSKSLVTLGENSEFNCSDKAEIYVLNGSDMIVTMYSRSAVGVHQKIHFSEWHQLTASKGDIDVKRLSTEKIEIKAVEGSLIEPFFVGALFRQNGFFPLLNQVVDLGRLKVHVKEVSSNGIERLEFTISGLGDENRACLLAYNGYYLYSPKLPKVGETARFEWHPGPNERAIQFK